MFSYLFNKYESGVVFIFKIKDRNANGLMLFVAASSHIYLAVLTQQTVEGVLVLMENGRNGME